MRVLFVENDCSFSWNIVDRLPVERADVRVVHGSRKAEIRSLLAGTAPLRGAWGVKVDALVIGSGPLDPLRVDLVGLVGEAAVRHLPTLGICLGHQAVGLAFGARLRRTEPAHGVRSTAHFGPSRLFTGIEGPVEVMRYHSLSLCHVPDCLRVVASTGDIPMAVEHSALPIAGLQFHPDSFGTPRGADILRSWFDNVRAGHAALSA